MLVKNIREGHLNGKNLIVCNYENNIKIKIENNNKKLLFSNIESKAKIKTTNNKHKYIVMIYYQSNYITPNNYYS